MLKAGGCRQRGVQLACRRVGWQATEQSSSVLSVCHFPPCKKCSERAFIRPFISYCVFSVVDIVLYCTKPLHLSHQMPQVIFSRAPPLSLSLYLYRIALLIPYDAAAACYLDRL